MYLSPKYAPYFSTSTNVRYLSCFLVGRMSIPRKIIWRIHAERALRSLDQAPMAVRRGGPFP
jgi:hypothetical protein